MKLSKYIAVMAIVSLAAGCEQAPVPGPVMPEVRVETAVNSFTRAKGPDFKTGDQFGLYLIAYQGQTAPEFGTERFRDNLVCTKTATGVEMPRIYYPETGRLDFYAYYPYTVDGVSADDPQWVSHAVKANQADALNFDEADFLTAVVRGVVPSDDAVPMVFSHRMSLVNVQLLPGAGMKVEELKNARMTTSALASACRVNIATGVVAGVSGAVSVTPNGNQVTVEGTKVSMMSFVAIPQTIPAGVELFDIVVATKHYKFVTDRDVVLASGFKYLMEITLQPAAPKVAARITAISR